MNYADLPSELRSSVDDLRSTLGCRLATVSPETLTTEIVRAESLLAFCPDDQRTKRKILETHLRALNQLSPLPAASADSSSEQSSTSAPGTVSEEVAELADAPDTGAAAAGTDRPEKASMEVQVLPSSPLRPLTIEALEVLPPIRRAPKGETMPLREIEDHIRAFDARIEERTRGYHNDVIYDIVGKGLMLLKARAAHIAEGFQKGNKAASKNVVETVSTTFEKQLAKAEEKAEQGFLAWLEGRFPEQSTRTARNYMNAARNAQLTSDHTLEDVDALRTAQALHEKKPTDLYKLAEPLKTTPSEHTPLPAPNLVADTQRDLFASLDSALTLRDDMPADVYEAIHTRLHATLEKLTGAKWVMTDEAPSADSAVHGEVQEDAKRLTPNERALLAAKQKARWAKAQLKKGAN